MLENLNDSGSIVDHQKYTAFTVKNLGFPKITQQLELEIAIFLF